MPINGIKNYADGITRPLVKKFKNGKTILTLEKKGKTITQVIDTNGRIHTRIKEIYSSPTRSSVKKTYIKNNDKETVNNITLKHENGTKTKLAILDNGEHKIFYNNHINNITTFDIDNKFLLLKSITSRPDGTKQSASYNSNFYNKKNSANFLPIKRSEYKQNSAPREIVYFNNHGVPTWPQINLDNIEKYL